MSHPTFETRICCSADAHHKNPHPTTSAGVVQQDGVYNKIFPQSYGQVFSDLDFLCQFFSACVEGSPKGVWTLKRLFRKA